MNIIQPYQSTLQFNSTLFINRAISSVGINTQPNFNLDVQVAEVVNAVAGAATIVNEVQLISSINTSIYYAFVDSTASLSNVQVSLNGSQYSNTNIFFNVANYTTELTSFFSAGDLFQYFLGQTSILGYSAGTILYKDTVKGFTSYPNVSLTAGNLEFIQGMATDGQNILATGTASPTGFPFFKIYAASYNNSFTIPVNFTALTTSLNIFPPIIGRSNGGYDIVYGGTAAPFYIVVGAGSNQSGPGFTSAYRVTVASAIEGNGQCTALNTTVDELRAIITYKTDIKTRVGDDLERGETVFVATGRMYNDPFTVNQGRIVISSDNGLTWSIFDNLFTETGLCLATDGSRIVVGGEDSLGNTMYYADARFAVDAQYQFAPCQGTLFTQRTNSVIYTGTKWVAGGNSGVLESLDGITWSNVGNLTTEVFSVGFSSNAMDSIRVTSSNNVPLLFQNSPNLQVQQIISVPTIAYYPSTLVLNNSCVLQTDQVIVPGYLTSLVPSSMISVNQPSTFYTNQAFVSSFVCTNQTTVGWYNLSIQTV